MCGENWMKEDHGKLMLQWLLPFGIAVIVVLIMFFNFSVKIKKEAADTVEDKFEEVAEKYALKVNGDIQGICLVGETAAQVISQQNPADRKNIQLLLASIADNTEIYEVIYCDKDGNAIDHLGNRIDLEENNYIEKLEKDPNINYLIEKKDMITGTASIIIGVPVEETGGSILLFYPLKRLKEITEMSGEFNDSAFLTIISAEGDIFQAEDRASSFLKGNNIWANVDREYQNDTSKARVRMQNNKTGSFITRASEEMRTLVYTPIGVEDWVLLIGVDQSYVEHRQEAIFSKSIRRLYQLLGVTFLFVALIAAVNYVGKIRSAERNKTLQEKADTDLLTGLNNKLATERKIKEYMAQNQDKLGMLFLIDIDNFKKINDTMGHAFGDEVLRSLGKQIGVNFRVTDIIGRVGGDEFMIFLKDLQKDEIVLREAKKLEYFFKHFEVGEYVKYSATASIGAAVFPEHGNDFESLYKSADQAVYKAKKRGKNQIAFFDDRDRKQ